MEARNFKPAIPDSAPLDLNPELGTLSAAGSLATANRVRSDERDHQTKVETQNSEFLLLQTELKESRDRYMDLYTFAPIGYLTLNSDAAITEINLTGVGMLMGGAHEDILQRRFVFFVSPEDRGRYLGVIAQAESDGERHSCAIALQRGDHSIFHVQLDCVRERVAGTSPNVRITITDLSERKRMESEIEDLAFNDSLTQLPNRRRLMDRLRQAALVCVRTRCHAAILIIDLDDFKTLNDTQGHDAGDRLLQQAAQRLTACVRAVDTVARLGGDEFVVLLESLSREPLEAATQVRSVGEKILRALSSKYLLGLEEYRSSGSIGISLFGAGPEPVKDLLKRADLALYRSKSAGGGVMCFFEQEMQTAVTTRAALETDLRKGLRDKQFLLYYQPQVDHRGLLIGVEALVRWQHPSRGLLAPGEFISLAEEKGFIIPLGQWILETACRQLVAWRDDSDTSHLTLSVNVSAHEFRHPKFVIRMLDIIGQSGANPDRLILEFTESSVLGNVDETISKIGTLRTHGVRFSLDDFGIGYSSLTYLKNLPVDQLKIDRSFVSNVVTDGKDAAIVRSIITLGTNLGLSVIAEGIETIEQRDFLLTHGCKAFQGFLFGKPNSIQGLPSALVNFSGH